MVIIMVWKRYGFSIDAQAKNGRRDNGTYLADEPDEMTAYFNPG